MPNNTVIAFIPLKIINQKKKLFLLSFVKFFVVQQKPQSQFAIKA